MILPYNRATEEFIRLQLLLQISKPCSKTCTMARIQGMHMHEVHMTENGQMINIQSQTGSSGDIHPP